MQSASAGFPVLTITGPRQSGKTTLFRLLAREPPYFSLEDPDTRVTAHPQRGALFENWIMTELLKAQTNLGIKPSLHFLRDKEGHEIYSLIETAPGAFQAI